MADILRNYTKLYRVATLSSVKLPSVAQCCLLASILLISTACSLPSLHYRSSTTAFDATIDTRLGRSIAPMVAAHPDTASGVHLLTNPYEAMAARVHLARSADISIDAQYYIWRADIAGTLLFEELFQAAERGVRVRLLLDDNGTQGIDKLLAALNAHPNIEIRLFNPFLYRNARWFGFLTDFSRLNRRMHNKLYIVDNQVAIAGGRNIGDEYYQVPEQTAFIDADLLGVGPVVRESSRDFDRYWASLSAYPAELILSDPSDKELEELHNKAKIYHTDEKAKKYIHAMNASGAVQRFLAGDLPWHWVSVRMISDPPAKGLGQARSEDLLPAKLFQLAGIPEKSMELISPYFVPQQDDIAAMTNLAQEGVHLQILTNSLSATDVAVVHSGYAGSRTALLNAGVNLYEWRHSMAADLMGQREGIGQSSASSLHAKTFAIDGKHLFVGSFNFDPRSIRLNTESGFIVHSELLTAQMEEAFILTIPFQSYEVRLSPQGSLYWLERREDGRVIRHDQEPHTSWLQRRLVDFLAILPIKWLL